MKKVGFITNINRDTDRSVTRTLTAFVQSLGCEAIEFADSITTYVDFIVVLGGDGTMLRAARYAAPQAIPLLGINLGNVGYLTDADRAHAKESITKVLAGDFKIEQRMMLEAHTAKSGPHLALNDVAIYRGAVSRLVECQVSVNGDYMDTFRADGLVVATPTGSTAYSLAAGGPVLKPDAKMMVITPISPQSLSARPVVLPHSDTIKIRLKNTPQIYVSKISISFDGEGVAPAEMIDIAGDEIVISISASPYHTNIIKTKDFSFYETLRMKIGRDFAATTGR